MKKRYEDIIESIKKEAEKKRESAGYSGSMGDGGASQLEENLKFFQEGYINGLVTTGSLEGFQNREVEVPHEWQEYFIHEDPEYQDYLRLSEKFGHIRK